VKGFVALDGPDGSGKSTQARLLCEALRQTGQEVVHLREPGSTPFGERVRAALLDPDTGELDALTEALAFSAARRTMLEREVAPALARGALVVAERCFLSTVVYQCRAPLLPEDRADEALIRDVTRAVHRDLRHDLVLVLDIDGATGVERAGRDGGLDRIERRGPEFHVRVRDGFVALARRSTWVADLLDGRIAVIDAGRSVEQVHREVRETVAVRLGAAGGSA
jgi:dTMP kinase